MSPAVWIHLLTVAGASPDLAVFDDLAWKDLGARRTDVGPVAVQAAWLEKVGCVQGTVDVGLAPHDLLAVTADMVSAKDWSTAPLSTSEVLERSERSFVLFQVLDVPGWTLSADRYWVIEATPEQLGDGARYRWHRVAHDRWPEVAEQVGRAIEPPVNFGEWRFDPSEAGTSVRYRSCADFGGPVPPAVQRWINTQQLPALVADLVQEAERRAD